MAVEICFPSSDEMLPPLAFLLKLFFNWVSSMNIFNKIYSYLPLLSWLPLTAESARVSMDSPSEITNRLT
jgi:hypothetical protein